MEKKKLSPWYPFLWQCVIHISSLIWQTIFLSMSLWKCQKCQKNAKKEFRFLQNKLPKALEEKLCDWVISQNYDNLFSKHTESATLSFWILRNFSKTGVLNMLLWPVIITKTWYFRSAYSEYFLFPGLIENHFFFKRDTYLRIWIWDSCSKPKLQWWKVYLLKHEILALTEVT